MTLRAAVPADAAALDAFLLRHAEGAMFPLGNLRAHGLGRSDHRHATGFWLAGEGQVTGAVGRSTEGMIMPCWPDGNWAALRGPLDGAAVTGMVGPAAQVRAALAALGLDAAPRRYDADEPGFALPLEDLILPEGPGESRPVGPADAPLAEGWRAAYLAELFATPAAEAAITARRDVAGWIAAGSHHLLWQGDRPLALCGVNAALPEIVQVGGVWTPPELRGRGHARRAVGLMLAAAKARGVARAVLFAASTAAARAYVALGFRPIDPVALVLFDGPQRVPPCP